MPPRRADVLEAWAVAAIAVAAGLLAVAYALPTVTFETITSAREVYSIWGGIVSLWQDGNWFLAPVVFAFSIAFPIAKLALLARLALRRRRTRRSSRSDLALLRRLRWLGKWSMLDVWIVGLFVGSIRIGIATASSRIGIQVFAAAIVVSMVAAMLSERAAEAVAEDEPAPRRRTVSRAFLWTGRAVSVAAAAAVACALALPLLRVSKSIFFANEVGLVATARSMADEGELTLGAGLLVFVAGISAAMRILSLGIWWLSRFRQRIHRAAVRLEEWAMLDVFALALAIVHVKLDELTRTQLEAGFALVHVAACLAVLDAWLLRRRLDAEDVARPPRSLA